MERDRDAALAAARVARERTQRSVEAQRTGPLARMASWMADVREHNHLAASIRMTFDDAPRGAGQDDRT